MKGVTLKAFLTGMDIGLFYSRPRVSNDSPFIEAFFKTTKYDTVHMHSGIGYVLTPPQKELIHKFASSKESLLGSRLSILENDNYSAF